MATDGGQFRLEIYKFLESELGRSLTEAEQSTLRLLLKNYVNFKTKKYQSKITVLSNKLHKNKKPKHYGRKKSTMESVRRGK